MKPIYYVGLDVHKETISIAYALGGSRDDATYHGQCAGSVAAAVKALQKLAEKLKIEFRDLNSWKTLSQSTPHQTRPDHPPGRPERAGEGTFMAHAKQTQQ